MPKVFTEQGIYMLMTVLRGEREYLLLSLQVSENLFTTMELRSDLRDVEERLANVIDKLGDFVTHSELSETMPPFEENEDKRGFLLLNAKPFWGDLVYDEIYSRARKTIFIVDNYIGIRTLEKLINIPKGVKVLIFSDNLAKLDKNTYLDFCKEYPNISINLFCSGGVFHDRYIILDYDTSDEKIFLCGGSSKDAGRKITSILEDPDRKKYDSMIKELLQNPPLTLK